MSIIFLGLYWIMISIIIIISIMIVYHIWVYYLSRKLAWLTTVIFLSFLTILLIFNFISASRVDWSFFDYFLNF